MQLWLSVQGKNLHFLLRWPCHLSGFFAIVPIFVANVELVSEMRLSQLSSGVPAFPRPCVHAHVR